MKIDKNIVIAALARDCEKSLPMMIELIEQLRLHFVWSHVVVVENDSKDNTKEILFDWETRKPNVKIISKDYGTLTIPLKSAEEVEPLVSFHRIEKMVTYRNIYLNYITELQKDIDNVVVIDIDIESFSVDGVIAAIEKSNGNCGAIFANGFTFKIFLGSFYSKIFYDVFAVYEYPLKKAFSCTEKSLYRTRKSVMANLMKCDWYRVISAFGGLAVYNYGAISNLRYKVVPNAANINEAVCEHIPFNTEIVELGYENFISRNMEVVYGKHSLGSILHYYLDERIFNFFFKISRIFK